MKVTRRAAVGHTALAGLTAALALGFMPKPPPAPPKADPQMQAVLDQLTMLGGKPIETLTPEEARKQPTPTDAVKALLVKQGKSTDPEPVGKVEDATVPGPAGTTPVRIYTPAGDGPFPVVVYVHGGGWVIATIDTYDSSARAMCNLAKAVIVSIEYRKAPEYKFPAAHEDVYAALQYVMKNAATMNGDPKRVAIMGESAGGNMAAAACMMAKDRKGMMPIYQVLIYPVANYAFNTPSYKDNTYSKPLNKAMMKWFFNYTLKTPDDGKSKYISLIRASNSDLQGLPPATVITDDIDPLNNEGLVYASMLRKAGDKVEYKNYQGVTHEFFGMGAVVDKAKDAEQFAADGLKMAFASKSASAQK